MQAEDEGGRKARVYTRIVGKMLLVGHVVTVGPWAVCLPQSSILGGFAYVGGPLPSKPNDVLPKPLARLYKG